jgi:4-amino-4-deoxy-L-arabinose transferase-like glycosyltransferase
MAGLGAAVSGGNRRVGFLAAGAFTIFPAYLLTSLVMTIDTPHLACWMLACWAAARAFQQQHAGTRAWGWWLTLGAALGLGFLFKYTILLLLVGLVAYALWERRRLKWTPSSLIPPAAAALLFLIVIGPVLIWNQQRHWPTVSHLLGRLELPGGDVPPAPATGWSLAKVWTPWLILDQLAILNVAAALIFLTLFHRRPGVLLNSRSDLEKGATGRPSSGGPCSYDPKHGSAQTPARGTRIGQHARPQPAGGDPGASDRRLLLCCALPILAFYLVASFLGKVQDNWPLPGYATLLVLVAQRVAEDPARAPIRVLWRAAVVVGLVLAVGVFAAAPIVQWPWMLAHVPALRHTLERVSGSRPQAQAVAAVRADLQQQTGREPFVIAVNYATAGLMAFYLPDHPSVCCASALKPGGRKSAYDYFADTDLSNPQHRGRPVVLVGWGGSAAWWNDALTLADVTAAPATRQDANKTIFIGTDYAGPRAQPPSRP